MSIPSKTPGRGLTHIKQLIDTCHFKEALQAVETLEHRDDLAPPDRLTCHLLKIQLLNNLGRYEETLKLTEVVIRESQRKRNRLHRVDALIARAEALYWLGRFDEGFYSIKQGEHELVPLARDQPTEVPQRTAALMFLNGFNYYWKGESDRALDYLEQSLALREKLGHKKDITDSLVWIGLVYFNKGEWDRALEYGLQSLALAKELGHKLLIAWTLLLIGRSYSWKGEGGRALDYGQQGLALAKELDHKPLIAWFLLLIGWCYGAKGESDRGFEYIQQSLTLCEEFGIKAGMAQAHNNIGFFYMEKGELDQALAHLEQSIVLFEELVPKRAIAVPLSNIGRICFWRGEWDQAIAHLEQSLPFFEEAGNKVLAAEVLYYLISVAIDQTALEQARRYLQRLQQLNEQEDNKIISQWHRVAEALVLKTSLRARNRVKAEELLTQVVEEEIVLHDVTVAALLQLCDLLLIELRITDDPVVLGELQAHVNRLFEIATQQRSTSLFAETYLLKAKLALMELDVQGAQKLLSQAQVIAEERGLRRLAMQISIEHDTLLDQLSQWKDFIARNVPLTERAELAHLEEQVIRMIRQRVEELPEQPEEDPELLLIIGADSGLSVFSKSFRPDRPLADQLIAGFLTAINAFGRDAFAERGSIERLKYAEHTLLLQAVDPFLVSYVFQGPSYFALQKLAQFSKALQESTKVWQVLMDALKTRRFIMDVKEMETLVTEMFLTTTKDH